MEPTSICSAFSSQTIWENSVKISTILFVIIAVISLRDHSLYGLCFLTKCCSIPGQDQRCHKTLRTNDPSSFLEYSHSNIIEYQNINLALAQLINQKILLTNEKQAEAFEKKSCTAAVLPAADQLSFFFINCLKSLHNMLESKQYIKNAENDHRVFQSSAFAHF